MEKKISDLRRAYQESPIRALEVAIEPLETIANEIIGFIRAKTKKGVIGLSGGLDSTVVAYLSVKALGPENVYGVILPTKYNATSSQEDAELVAEELGIRYRIIPIPFVIESCKQLTPDLFKKDNPYGNLQARIRMCYLYAFANNGYGMVLGTDNKSENMTGYFTKYGDSGVDINPIGDFYKTQVRKLAEFLDVPKQIIDKAPAAELGISRTDEEEIGMSYETLDKILFGGDLGFSKAGIKIHAKVRYEDILRVEDLFHDSKHKRALPPSPGVIKYV